MYTQSNAPKLRVHSPVHVSRNCMHALTASDIKHQMSAATDVRLMQALRDLATQLILLDTISCAIRISMFHVCPPYSHLYITTLHDKLHDYEASKTLLITSLTLGLMKQRVVL